MSVEVIRAISLGQFPHGFLGRRGGMSVGEHAGLNVGYGSDDENIVASGDSIIEARQKAESQGFKDATFFKVPPSDKLFIPLVPM